jgi:hypothetical protein
VRNTLRALSISCFCFSFQQPQPTLKPATASPLQSLLPQKPAGLPGKQLKSAWRQPAFRWLRARAMKLFKPFAMAS